MTAADSGRAESRMPRLTGRTILVAGGTGNVGRTLVREFLVAGAGVIVPSRSIAALERTRAAIDERHVANLAGIEADFGRDADATRLRTEIQSRAGALDAVVASLGRFVAAPSVLSADPADLQAVVNDYLVAHFMAARTFMPLIAPGGSYIFINGPLAFEPLVEGAGLVSIATAGQAMLARVLMKEGARLNVRVNEVVLYTPFGWGDKAPVTAPISQEQVARYVALLVSERGQAMSGQTIHLASREPLDRLLAGPQPHSLRT